MSDPRELPRVRVNGAGGETAIVRLVEERDGMVYVIGEEEYQRARAEGQEIEARLGYPKEDVTAV